MTKFRPLLSVFMSGLLFSGILFSSCNSTDLQSVAISKVGVPSLVASSVANNKYIVIINEDVDQKAINLQTRKNNVISKAQGILKKHQIAGDLEEVYQSALKGFTVRLTPAQVKLLANDNSIKSIEPDAVISLSPINANGKPTPPAPTQATPWGITRVGGGTTTPSGTAWIIDTGIDLDHPDLNVDLTRSVTFLGAKTTPNDENGHGSHVSGIIAAKNNSIGVVGVAPGAKLVSVRVLNRSGSGTISGVIAGVDYVAEKGQAGDVANMSLGGSVSGSLDLAVLNASANVKFVLAAGNETDDANNHSPARVNGPNIYTISAMNSSDNWASFSNFGNPPVDYCAPGVSIYSTYKDAGYATLSGTSMAAPHVSGLLLIGALQTSGTVNGDPDGNPDPIAHH
ncbi:MAG TPA: S8 family serine peptidase [Paludibacter sp.]|nr:S8 family serine peptidase [Paludibacter sp.]